MMRKTFQYRAYPNIGVRRRLVRAMKRAATPVWNACVAEREAARELYRAKLDDAFCEHVRDVRRDITEKEEKTIRRSIAKEIHWPTAYDQYRHIRKRDHPEYAGYNVKMLECVIAKIDSSEKSFRALWIKGDTKARPPKQTRIHECLTFRCSGWTPQKPDMGRVVLSMIGPVKFKLHRPVEGKVKTVSVTRKNGKWYIGFSCEIPKISGACGPVSEAMSGNGQDLRQEHTSTGRKRSRKRRCAQPGCPEPLAPIGRKRSRKRRCAQPLCYRYDIDSGGSDPEKGGAHNRRRRQSSSDSGGSDPEKGGAHNNASK